MIITWFVKLTNERKAGQVGIFNHIESSFAFGKCKTDSSGICVVDNCTITQLPVYAIDDCTISFSPICADGFCTTPPCFSSFSACHHSFNQGELMIHVPYCFLSSSQLRQLLSNTLQLSLLLPDSCFRFRNQSVSCTDIEWQADSPPPMRILILSFPLAYPLPLLALKL